jgi:antitoxin component of MazEF toxin-antitoxin module
MTKKLVRHGNSMALIIEKPLLSILKITEGSDVEVTIENDSLVIRAASAGDNDKTAKMTRQQEIEETVKRVMKQYDEVFRALAKT